MFYDTHSHPYLAKELSKRAILESFFSWWWVYLNSIACDINSSRESIELSKSWEWVYASIWIHPTHTLKYLGQDISNLMSELKNVYLENSSNIIAIGETWLDYHWVSKLAIDYNIPEITVISHQKLIFKAQLKLAQELNLPVIIHNRNSSDDILKILLEIWYKNFVFHCFSEDLNYAKKLTDFAPNCKLWFWWIVTFKNAINIQEVAEKIGLKNIIIETDSPYLTPAPYRWKRENEPILVREVLSKIIDLRSEGSETITKSIFQNSIEFFNVES